jgi:hypothetical protein
LKERYILYFAIALLFLPQLGLYAQNEAEKSDDRGQNTLGQRRDISIPWQKVPEATGYQIQILKKGENPEQVDPLSTEVPRIELIKEIGLYRFRIRTLDPLGRKGPWSPFQELKIPPRPIESASPSEDILFEYASIKPSIQFQWETKNWGGPYLFELQSSNGRPLVRKVVNKTNLKITGVPEGSYQWGVIPKLESFDSNNPMLHTFRVEQKDLEPPVLNTPVAKEALPSDQELSFNWKPSKRAAFHRISIEPLANEGRSIDQNQKIEEDIQNANEYKIRLEPGKYRWLVTAFEGENTEGVSSQSSLITIRSSFETPRHQWAGGLGISGVAFTAYDYLAPAQNTAQFDSVINQAQFYYRYRPFENWRFSAESDLKQVTLIEEDLNILNLGLSIEHRLALPFFETWYFNYGLQGIRRQHFVIGTDQNDDLFSDRDPIASTATTLNLALLFSLSGQLSARWSLEFPLRMESSLSGLSNTELGNPETEQALDFLDSFSGLNEQGGRFELGARAHYALTGGDGWLPKSGVSGGLKMVSESVFGENDVGPFIVESNQVVLETLLTIGF